MKVCLKPNWPVFDPDFAEESVQACLKALETQRVRQESRELACLSATTKFDVEPSCKEWKPLPESNKWRFLREQIHVSSPQVDICMHHETFMEVLKAFSWATPWVICTDLYQIPSGDGFTGTLWNRKVYRDLFHKRETVSMLIGSRLVKTIFLENLTYWEDYEFSSLR